MSQIASSTSSTGRLSLYGSYTSPQLYSIQQGALGDCFFLSSVNSILNQSPVKISSLITQNLNGSFTVRFPGHLPLTFSITDSEIAAMSQTTNNGCWLTVLGVAENHYIAGEAGVPQVLRTSPLGVLSDGGYPAQALALMTGKNYKDINLSQYSAASISQLLTTELATNTPIGVSTQDHALAVLGFSSASSTATVLNPWGVSGSFGYNEDPGFSNPGFEVQMTNGIFQVSTSDIVNNFYSLTVPTSVAGQLNTGVFGARGAMLAANTAGIGVNHNSPSLLPYNVASVPNAPFGPAPNTPPSLLAPSNSTMSSPQTFSMSALQQLPVLTLPSSTAVIPTQSVQATPVPGIITSEITNEKPASLLSMKDRLEMADKLESIANREVLEDTAVAPGDGTLVAEQGSLFVMQEDAAMVQANNATIKVAPQAAALIVNLDNEIAVSNLCDSQSGDITISIDGQEFNVPMGRTILLRETNAKSSKLMECIEHPQALAIETNGKAKAFTGHVSYGWALKNCPQFRKLMHSSVPAVKSAASRVIKSAAAAKRWNNRPGGLIQLPEP
jgi:hypothetical protein